MSLLPDNVDNMAARATALHRRFMNDAVCVEREARRGYPRVLNVAEGYPALFDAHTGGNAMPTVTVTFSTKAKPVGWQETGRFRLCAYATTREGTRQTRFGVIDIDDAAHHRTGLRAPVASLRRLLAALQADGLPAYACQSSRGQGYHIFVLFADMQPAADVHRLLAHYRDAEMTLVRAGGDAAAGIEILPSVQDIHGRGMPRHIRLPWWHGAEGTRDELFTMNAAGERQPATPEELVLVDSATLNDILVRLPYAALPPLSDATPASTPRKPTNKVDDGWDTWWRAMRDRLDLRLLYGQALTDQRSGEMLLAHDHRNGRRDENPSAAVVADGPSRGNFIAYTAEGHDALNPAEYLLEMGECTSMHQALQRLAEFARMPLPKPVRTRGQRSSLGNRVSVVAAPAEPTASSRAIPLEDARLELLRVVDQIVLPAAKQGAHQVLGIRASTGVGKTAAFSTAISQAVCGGSLPIRVLYLVPTREVLTEITTKYFTDAATGTLLPDVGVASPRSDADGPGYCALAAQAQAIGGQRQSITRSLCHICDNHASCAYLRTLDSLRTKRVVLATHESYLLATPSRLEEFDLIIVDEAIADILLEDIAISQGQVQIWEQRASSVPYAVQAHRVLATLKRALIAGAAEGVADLRDGRFLLPVLLHLDPKFDVALATLVAAMKAEDPMQPGRAIDHLSLRDLRHGAPVPLYGFAELLLTLAEEAAAGDPVDTRCWLVGQASGASHVIHLLRPRYELAGSLQATTTVLLDATLPEQFLRQFFGESLTVMPLEAERYVATTLFTDSLYRLHEHEAARWDRRAVERFLQHICRKYQQPLIVCPKALRATLAVPDNAAVTHYWASDAVGSNKYEACDAVILIGHHQCPQANHVRAASALRAAGACRARIRRSGDHDPHARTKVRILAEGYRLASGDAIARETSYPADSLARDFAIDAYAATVAQTIGRARPSNPPRRHAALPVWLLIGEPPRGLPIHQVTTLPAWLEANDPTWLHDNPVPEGRVGCENRHGLNQCAAANTRRQEEAFARLARAHQALLDDGRVQAGERPTQKALITRTKALCGTTPSADTVKRYLAVAEERGFAPLSIRYSYESSSPNPPQAVDRSPASEGFDVANGAALAPHVVPMEVMLPAIAQNVLDDILDSAACELLGIA